MSGVSPVKGTPPDTRLAGGLGAARSLRDHPPTTEQRAALLAGKHITYTLKRSSRRRSIGLRIDHRGLTVSMPLRASERWLHRVLQDKAVWVVEKLDGWQARMPAAPRWEDGELIPFLGETLTLRLHAGLGDASATLSGEELHVNVVAADGVGEVERRVRQWYRKQAAELFAARVAHYAPRLGVAPREIKLSAAKTQWGSCTSRGTVRLNERLIHLPLRLVDYVVVHELAHLREMNHSAAFWAVVHGACPDYAGLRRELKALSP